MQKRNQYDKMIDFIPASWANALKLECNKLIAKGAFFLMVYCFLWCYFLRKKDWIKRKIMSHQIKRQRGSYWWILPIWWLIMLHILLAFSCEVAYSTVFNARTAMNIHFKPWQNFGLAFCLGFPRSIMQKQIPPEQSCSNASP
jgi:hypothetical protein